MENNTFAHVETTANSSEQKKLQLLVGSGVYRFERLRHNNRRPVAYEQVVMPHYLLPGFELRRMSSLPLHEIAQHYGLSLGKVVEQISKVTASAVVAERLDLSELEIQELDRVTFTANGLPLEWRVIYSIL